ncbi:hypothetical protein Q1695_004990 [Nippostrongylus brasiliensis]|nr:hypothetical protein Q1695_004990 [Nippostrongylus brasiliensis]
MASRPRRSCAKGDTSVLSPSSIFLWSDTRLRQELTRRGLSKTGIRQDLIDRLLDDINGVISKSAGSADGNGPAENQFLTPKREVEDEPDPPEQQNSVAAVETPKERRPRTKKQKLNISENTKPQFNENSGESGSISTDDKAQESSKQDDETPARRPRRQRKRASAGEDAAFPQEPSATSGNDGKCGAQIVQEAASLETSSAQPGIPKPQEKGLEDSRTLKDIQTSTLLSKETTVPSARGTSSSFVEPTSSSIQRPILSILPKVRPLPIASVINNSACSTPASSASSSSTTSTNHVQKSIDTSFSLATANSDIYDSSSEDQTPIGGKPSASSKKCLSGNSSSSTYGASLPPRKSSFQKDDEERSSQKRASQASTSTKPERPNAAKPITAAWAERLAELKKADPAKFSGGTAPKEKVKVREVESRGKVATPKASPSATGQTLANVKKASAPAKSPAGLDLLDSIMTQQTEFLQTMRRSEERNSPEPEIVDVRQPKLEEPDVSQSDRIPELPTAAEEAYKRFERTFAAESTVNTKSSPKSPQLFQPLPPPPPPPKPAALISSARKSLPSKTDYVHLLVPPPPPPPPQHLLVVKDVPPPPPPPPRRRPSALEDLPPPPPPPKRLKPARLAKTDVVVEVKQEVTTPPETPTTEEAPFSNDVKECLEYVLELVSSIRPIDETHRELLPAADVPIPFSQQRKENAPIQPSSEAVTFEMGSATRSMSLSAESNAEGSKVSAASLRSLVEGVEDDEEYDPLEATIVEDIEPYVPSAVVSRNVTLDLSPSQNSPPDHVSSAEDEPYSPPPHVSSDHPDDDFDEGEITEDSDSEIQSIGDDSEDESDGDDVEPQDKTFMRRDDSGRFIRVVRRSRKRDSALPTQPRDEQQSVQENVTLPAVDDEAIDEKPDPALLNDPRHLLQRASAVLQGLGNLQGTQYKQMPYDEDYEEEEVVQPIDSFHGEPVPDDDELFEVAAGLKPKRKDEVVIEERISTCTDKFEIDFYNGDLHLKGAPNNDWIIDPDNQDGLALVWGGVRSTHGILPSCRGEADADVENAVKTMVFQVKITDLLTTRHLPFDELDPNDVRVGFSLRSAPLVLGEYTGSYCCTSLGKRANNNVFTDYGDSFGVGDVITAQMDFENGSISFWKNSEFMGVAFENIAVPEGEAVYPHICVKNCRVSVNFGTFPGGEEEWLKQPNWVFVNALPRSQTERAPVPPESKSDCTVLMMVGLPSVGKTTWVRRYIREHPSEHWTLISADTILASMKVNGVSRNSSHIGRWDMVLGLVGKARNRLLSLAARRRRNYILDFTNCDPDTRKRRLALFEGFFRQCVTIVPSDEVMQQRHAKHLRQNRGEGTAAVPIETFLELKAVMEMPVVSEFLESVIYVDPAMEDAQIAIDRIAKFNEEGRPWYSNKYNKKRGFWNGTYGDEPYRKPSTTTTTASTNMTTRTQPVAANEKTPVEISNSTSSTVVNIPQPPPPLPQLDQPPPNAAPTTIRLDAIPPPPPPRTIENSISSSSQVGNLPNLSQAAPSSTLIDGTNGNCRMNAMFSQPPPPTNAPLVVHASNSVAPTIPLTVAPQISPFPMISPSTNHISPVTVQITNFSPRSRWDAPPTVLPNFSVPPPTLVKPNLFVPNTAAVPPPMPMIPLIPNTAVPPPNVPPPGWPPRLG